MKRKLVKKSNLKKVSRYIENKNILTSEQKKKVKKLFSPYKKTSLLFHSFYTEKTGVFSELYIPTDIHSNYIDEFYNNRYAAKSIDNKCNYPLLFAGIPQAKIIVYRSGGLWYDSSREMISKEKLEELISCESEIFVKKSTDSFGGKGVQYISAEKSMMYSQFENAIKDISSDIVVQYPLRQHSALAAINESSVNTIRALSLLREDGVKIYSCVLRMGVGKSKVDNASSGGITCGIKDDGKLRKRAYKPSGESFETHPTSGVVFDEYLIPGFEEMKQIIKKAHPMVPHFKMVSWDFSIDQQGHPVMIEANLCCGELDFHQLNNGPLFGDDTKAILNEVFGKK